MVNSGHEDMSVVAAAAAIVGRLESRLAPIADSVQQLLVTEIAELRGDAQLLQLMRDNVAGNIDTFFSAVRHNIPMEHLEPPVTALEYARRLAQRDVPVNALMRAYRLGQEAVLEQILGEARATNADPGLVLGVYELLSALSFDYIDWISQRVVAAYQDERERWLESRSSLRASLVRRLLSEEDVDVDTIMTAIRYPLKATHLGLVVWRGKTDGGADPTPMEYFVSKAAESIGARESCLFVPVDQVTGWAWMPLPAAAAEHAVAKVRAFTESAPDGPHIAIGSPMPGVAGFRRSHQQARNAYAVAISSGFTTGRVIAASDPGLALATLLANNISAAAAWVVEVLGPLASATDSDRRLRETLRVFLRTGSSYTAAAAELHLHFNSVKYRVQRAIERRGRPISDDRCDVEVALTLCYWFGTAVLDRPPSAR